ncbi:hypothetical protein Dimus_022919 [Dionaea muscipula]
MGRKKKILRSLGGSGSGGGIGGVSVMGDGAGGGCGGVSVRSGGSGGVSVGVGAAGLVSSGVPSSELDVAPPWLASSPASGPPPGSATENGSCEVALLSAIAEAGDVALGLSNEFCMDLEGERLRVESVVQNFPSAFSNGDGLRDKVIGIEGNHVSGVNGDLGLGPSGVVLWAPSCGLRLRLGTV